MSKEEVRLTRPGRRNLISRLEEEKENYTRVPERGLFALSSNSPYQQLYIQHMQCTY